MKRTDWGTGLLVCGLSHKKIQQAIFTFTLYSFSFCLFKCDLLPRYFHPVGTASSSSDCHCKAACIYWPSRGHRSDLVLLWQPPASWNPGPPATTGSGLCPKVTSPRPLGEEWRNENIKWFTPARVRIFSLVVLTKVAEWKDSHLQCRQCVHTVNTQPQKDIVLRTHTTASFVKRCRRSSVTVWGWIFCLFGQN